MLKAKNFCFELLKVKNRTLCLFIFSLNLLLFFTPCYSSNYYSDVKKGNEYYKSMEYDRALEKYDKAELENPNSCIIHFNKGAALYKKKDYQKAIEEFTKAMISESKEIEGKAAYNIGNSKYYLGKKAADADLSSAIKNYREALEYYKKAIDLNSNDMNAKYNYEFVERELKILQDKLKQQEKKKEEHQTCPCLSLKYPLPNLPYA